MNQEIKTEIVERTPPPSTEVAVGDHQVATVLAEVRGAMLLAKEFPRNYKKCWEAFTNACRRKEFAKKCEYSFPRGGKKITGPTIYVATEAARCFQNIHSGFHLLPEQDGDICILAWAWDVETNTRRYFPDRFKKRHQRKDKVSGQTVWVTPDERDLRELVNRRAAIAVRNALLSVLPDDFIEDGLMIARTAIKDNISDPEAEQKNLIIKFQKYRVTVEMINTMLGHNDWTLDDIVTLQGIYNSLSDGNSKVGEYFNFNKGENKSENGSKTDKLLNKIKNENAPEGTQEPPDEPDTETTPVAADQGTVPSEQPDEASAIDEPTMSEDEVEANELVDSLNKSQLINMAITELTKTFIDDQKAINSSIEQACFKKVLGDSNLSGCTELELANFIVILLRQQQSEMGD